MPYNLLRLVSQISDMNRILFFLLFIVNTTQAQLSSPLYSSVSFKYIDSVIRQDWNTQISTSTNFPYPYITAFPNSPHLFYWDTYFINKGLLATGQLKLAKQNTLNLLSVVKRFGYMGNAAITSWGMNRSQPPYLSVMVRDIYTLEKDTAFLHYAYPILKQEYFFWTNTRSFIEDHSTNIEGLQRFGHHATSKELIKLYHEVAKRLNLDESLADKEKIMIASRYAAEAETGMDFTLRFQGRCPDFIAVDLNTLIYCQEKNLSWISKLLKLKVEPDWNKLAEHRKKLINQYCWDEKSGLYYDFDYIKKRKSKIAAVTTFQPLWAGIASSAQAKKVVRNLPLFQVSYGLTTTAKNSKDEKYQWGCQSVWAPMQLIVVDGLNRYGFSKEAQLISKGYMDLIAKNFYSPVSSKKEALIKRKPGFIYEKYKADGTINDDEYIANPMMGWTAAVFNYLYRLKQ